MRSVDEEQLVRRLLDPKSQRSAFEQLVRLYSEQLYWQIRRMVLTHDDANDILQNVFLKAWSNLDKFHRDSKIYTWLYRIATNECLDFLRKQKTRDMVSADEPAASVVGRLLADRYFDGDKAAALLQAAIAQLPEVQHTVFNLRYFDGMKYSDMSQLLHTSEGSLKASYHIAVKKICEFFRQHD